MSWFLANARQVLRDLNPDKIGQNQTQVEVTPIRGNRDKTIPPSEFPEQGDLLEYLRELKLSLYEDAQALFADIIFRQETGINSIEQQFYLLMTSYFRQE